MTARRASPRPASAVTTPAFSRRTVTPPARPTARPAFLAATLATAASPAARASSAASTPTPTRPTAVRPVLSARRRVSSNLRYEPVCGFPAATDFRFLPSSIRQRPRIAHLLVRSLPSCLPGRLLPAGRSVDHQPVVLVRCARPRTFIVKSLEPKLTRTLLPSTATTVRVRSSRTKRVERRVLGFDRITSGTRSHVPSSSSSSASVARPFVVLHKHSLYTLRSLPYTSRNVPRFFTLSLLYIFTISDAKARVGSPL